MKLERVIEYLEGTASHLSPALKESETTSFVIDSREVKAGDVFFALSQPDYANNGFNGEFEDATAYVPSAFESGAVACVVRPDRFEERRESLEAFLDRLIFMDDAVVALQKLAHRVYLDWGKPVVAITGSAGKTTAKELTAHVLESSGRKVLKNIRNFNNGLGHPLTVLNLAKDPSYDIAVLEMGMSTPMNEIERLCRITPPDVAVELNVLPVHLEHLGSIENIQKSKAELVVGMKDGGTAVLNADDERVRAMKSEAKGPVITYGIDADADIRSVDISFPRFGETSFTLRMPDGEAGVLFPLNGRHNILNALAAAGVGHSLGMRVNEIAASLQTVAPPSQRGEVLRFAADFTVINDSYNSNPTALLSMVKTLVDGCTNGGRKIVVAGEMLELGEQQTQIHRRVGEHLASSGVDLLIGVRGLAREMVSAAGAAGLPTAFASDSDAAGEMVVKEIRPGDTVLIKGSRGVKTEKVLEKLLENFELEGKEKAVS